MDKKMNGLSREFIIHPGETLKEILDDRDMSQKELAIRTDVTGTHVSNIVNGQKSISVSYAKKLEYALGIDSSFWINLQANFDKELSDFEETNQISSGEIEVLKKLTDIIEYLKNREIIDRQANGPILVIQLRKIFKISSLLRIPEISQSGAYRLAKSTDVDPYVLFAWLRICEIMIDKETIDEKLDVEKLKGKIPLFKKLMFKDTDEVKRGLKSHLAECGIKFLVIKHFRGAPVQGVIKRNNDDTLSLIMTNRQKFADVFWFTFLHEIGHIINGDIKDKLIDYECKESLIEDKANEFASNTLIDPSKYKEFVNRGDFTLPSINKFCLSENIPNFILIGRLQREEYLEYYKYISEKVKYEMY